VTTAGGSREEIEVKLPAADLSALREKLRDAGAALKSPLHDEVNDLYDDADGRLVRSGRALRVRRAAGRATLTYKGAVRFREGAKVREERETEISEAGEIEGILAALGLSRTFRYEKRREEWELEGCAVALDRTPIGDFIEIEGHPPAIRRLVVRLGLDFADAVPYSYPELYARRRKEDHRLPPDMVFGEAAGENAAR
jgi:adenylate cyclase class 2